MRRTKEEADITRQRLLHAALTVFSRQGYSNTRLEDIAAEAGVTRGAIYHHFGSKAELYNTLVEEADQRLTPVVEAIIAEGGTALDIIRRIFVRTLVYTVENPDYRAVSELVLLKTEYNAPELEAGVNFKLAMMRELVDEMAAGIQGAIADGEVRPDVEPRDVAVGIMALQSGLLTLWLMDPTLFSLKERAEAMIDMVIQGIVARGVKS